MELWSKKTFSFPHPITDEFLSKSRSEILNAVSDRLSQATPAENYACLLDSCIEAQVLYH